MLMMHMKFIFVPQNFLRYFFLDQDQDFTIKSMKNVCFVF